MTRVRLVMQDTKSDAELVATIHGGNAMLIADGIIADFEKLGYVKVARIDH